MKTKTFIALCLVGIIGFAMVQIFENTLNDAMDRIEELQKENEQLEMALAETEVELTSFEATILDNYDYAEMLYGVDADLLEAIERLETGHFTSELYLTQNNTFGANSGGEFFTYDSHGQSTMELARTLRFNYLNKGLDTLNEIAIVFCPDDWENWALNVERLYYEVKGK